MEEGVEVKTTDNKTQVYRYLRDADNLNDQSDLYLTLYTTTDKVEDLEFEYLLVHILNHNYKLYCKMDYWHGRSGPCKLGNPYKFVNPLDPRDKATFEYRGLLHLKDCYLVDAETNMSVGDLDFLAKADILGMTYRSTEDFRCLIDKKGVLFRQKNLYVCDEPLCYERLGIPLCKPDDTPEEKQEKYDWQKTPQELSEQYPDNLILGGYSADNVCTLREIYLEYNRFGYDKPITCHIGFKNATVNFNPETNCMTVRLIDWGLWNPEDQSVFEHDCILDSIKITGWGYDHNTKGFYVPHFSEAWYNGTKVNVAEKTENIRITNFQDYMPMIPVTNKPITAVLDAKPDEKEQAKKDLKEEVENFVQETLANKNLKKLNKEVKRKVVDAINKLEQKDPPKPVKHVLVLTGKADKGYKEWTEEYESPGAPWCTVRCNLTGIFANIFGGDYRIAYERSCVRYSPDTHFNAIILEGLHLYHLGTGEEQPFDIMRHCDYIYGVEFRDNKSPQYVINSAKWNGIAIHVRPDLAQFHEPFKGKQQDRAGVIYVDFPDRMKDIDPDLVLKGKSNTDGHWLSKLTFKTNTKEQMECREPGNRWDSDISWK